MVDGGDSWVAPGATAPAGPAAPAPAIEPGGAAPAGPVPATPPAARSAPGRPPRLRPRTVTALMDDAFTMLRRRPRQLVTIAAVFVIPIYLVAGFLSRDALGDATLADMLDDPSTAEAASRGDDASAWAAVVQLGGVSLALPFVCAAITHVVVSVYLASEITTGEALRRAARRTWPLLMSWIVVHALEFAGIFLLVAWFVPMTFYVVTAPAVAAEALGPFAGMARSGRLVSRRFGAAMGLAFGTGLIAYTLSQALAGLSDVLAVTIGLRWGWVLLAAGRIGAALVTIPFVATATALFYLDLRVRTEGMDLLLDADRVLPQA